MFGQSLEWKLAPLGKAGRRFVDGRERRERAHVDIRLLAFQRRADADRAVLPTPTSQSLAAETAGSCYVTKVRKRPENPEEPKSPRSLCQQTVNRGISESRIEKRIVLSGDTGMDPDQVKPPLADDTLLSIRLSHGSLCLSGSLKTPARPFDQLQHS